jgi:hypothetical protein
MIGPAISNKLAWRVSGQGLGINAEEYGVYLISNFVVLKLIIIRLVMESLNVDVKETRLYFHYKTSGPRDNR